MLELVTAGWYLPVDLVLTNKSLLLFLNPLLLPLLLHRSQLFQAVLLLLLVLSLEQGKALLPALKSPSPASCLFNRPIGGV